MKKSALSVLVLWFVSTLCFAAPLNSLSKDQVIQNLQDKTLTLVPLMTSDGALINNSITAYFSPQGQVTGKVATKFDEDDPQLDQGTWVVDADGMLCTTWQHWDIKRAICVVMYEFDNGFIFVDPKTNKVQMIAFKINTETGNQVQGQCVSHKGLQGKARVRVGMQERQR